MYQHSWLFTPETIHIQQVGKNTVAARVGETHSWTVNPVAQRILELLEEPQTEFSLHQAIRAEFEVSDEDCQKAVTRFLQTVLDSGLAESLDDSGSNAVMRRRYLDLLKRSLVNLLYLEHELRIDYLAKKTRS